MGPSDCSTGLSIICKRQNKLRGLRRASYLSVYLRQFQEPNREGKKMPVRGPMQSRNDQPPLTPHPHPIPHCAEAVAERSQC